MNFDKPVLENAQDDEVVTTRGAESGDKKLSVEESVSTLVEKLGFKDSSYSTFTKKAPKENVFERDGDIFEFDPNFEGLGRFRGSIQYSGNTSSSIFNIDVIGVNGEGFIIKGFEGDETIIKEALSIYFLNPGHAVQIPDTDSSDKDYWQVDFERINVIKTVYQDGRNGPRALTDPER